MGNDNISANKALYGDSFVGDPSRKDSINLETMTYEQLIALEKLIEEMKKEFVSLRHLFILNGDEIPHLCRAEALNGPSAGYIMIDVFNNSSITKYGDLPTKGRVTDYLDANNIEYENKYYSMSDLTALWEPIRVKMIMEMLDAKQAKLDALRVALLPQGSQSKKGLS